MRKALLVSLAVFAIVVAGCISITWYLQARQAKSRTEALIAEINAAQPLITYEAIETSGFPAQIIVSVVKPRFSGRIDQLLARPGGEPLPEWQQDLALDGSISLGINALSDRYTLTLSGNVTGGGRIDGKPVAFVSAAAGSAACTLQMGRSDGWFGTLWNFKSLARDGETFIQDFRSLDCQQPGYVITDGASAEKLTSAGPQRFYLLSEPKGERQQIRVYAKSSDVETTPAGDALMLAYMKALPPHYPFATRPSVSGRQNMEVDLSYDGPRDFQSAKDASFDLQLSKFDFSNDLFRTTANWRVANTLQGDARDALLAFRWESIFGDQFATVQRDSLKGVIAQLHAGSDPRFAELQPKMQKHSPEEWYALAEPALPDVKSLGKTVLALDARYQGAANFTGGGDLTLTDFEISAAPYGLTGKGSGKLAAGQMLPSVNLAFVWANCLRMIDDMAGYYNRVQRVLVEFESEAKPLDPALVAGYKAFLSALAAPGADATTFNYAIVGDGTNVTVNGKPLDQVMALYAQHIAPHLQQPAAAPAN
jgi:hypothetical protein